MRTFVVGDVHGQAELLRVLTGRLRKLAEPGDALVFMGDYVDRGPDSRDVIEQVLRLRHGGWNGPVTPLRGNHEAMMLDFLAEEPFYEPNIWLRNGGLETLASYSPREEWDGGIPEAHVEFLRSLPLWHEDENGIYVHAGLRPGTLPNEAREEDCLWIREEFIESDYCWPKVVVFGHTPQYESSLRSILRLEQIRWRPLNRKEKIGIDTGAAYGGPLSAVILPEREFISVR